MPGVAAGEDGLYIPGNSFLHQPGGSVWYVYVLRSQSHPEREYTGASEDLRQRLADHNAGKSPHTAKFTPWTLLWYCAFPAKMPALAFEKYLKSHSGRVFAKKRLLPGGVGATADGIVYYKTST